MDHQYVAGQLEANKLVFQAMFQNVAKNEYLWKPQDDKWSLLEIICHLFDEEREDLCFGRGFELCGKLARELLL